MRREQEKYARTDFGSYARLRGARLNGVMDALLQPRRSRITRTGKSGRPAAVANAPQPLRPADTTPDAPSITITASHSVRLRPKTLARLRSIAHDLETPVSAVIKFAVDQAVKNACRDQRFAVPIRAQKPDKEREALDPNPQPVKLEEETEAGLRTIVAQSRLLSNSTVIRGAVEQFVDDAFRDREIVFHFAGANSVAPAENK